jgi:sensor c-di-GMP phosphodiesterase-like protein
MQTNANRGIHPAGTAAEQARRIANAHCAWGPTRKRNTRALLARILLLALLVAAFGFLAAISFARIPAQNDNRAEWARAERLLAEQQAEAALQRRARAAQAMCSSEHGPQVLAIWVDDTTVECVNARGRRLSSTGVMHASR